MYQTINLPNNGSIFDESVQNYMQKNLNQEQHTNLQKNTGNNEEEVLKKMNMENKMNYQVNYKMKLII